MTEPLNLPENTDDWTSGDVYQWVTVKLKLDSKYGEILKKEEVNGMNLKLCAKQDLIDMGIKHGPALQIINMFKELNSNCSEQMLGEKDDKKPEGQHVTQEKNRKSKKNQIDPKTDTRTKPKKACESSEAKPAKATKNHPEEIKEDPPYTGRPCSAYPFDRFHKSFRYKEHDVIIQPETGLSNLIEPVHEFKALTDTDGATEKDIKMKFSNEVFRFASACMNRRTNGTIHFGVKDKPHGEIVGVKLTEEDKSTFVDHFYKKIGDYFGKENVEKAKQCIRPPRFVEVLLKNDITSDRFVIEVDIIPKHSICAKKYFQIKMQTCKENGWEKNTEFSLFVRDGASTKDIYANPKQKDEQLNVFLSSLESQDESRKAAEDYRPKETKTESEGRKLVHLLTGNQDLDNSYYKWYILVVNKCHPSQIEHLDFLKEIRWFAVLEFDPESESNGVAKAYRKTRAANLHFPYQFQDNSTSIDEKIENLSLFKQPSWIFCNGRSDINVEEYQPLDLSLWFKKRATKIRKLISFLTCEDIMQPEKFLVVFLLLSPVEDPKDPFIETFSTFYQEMGGMDDILSISVDPQAGSQWKDLLQVRFSATDLTNRCITTLSLEQLNGTILKRKSQTESPLRFLPSHGSSIILQKKVEDSLTALEILCENECKGTDIEKDKTQFTKFQKSQEEHFYLGGKVSWWNFYFSSENYSLPFIKRDSYLELEEMIQSLANSPRETCAEVINLYHHPGCGGTTLAMHVLWELKSKFRCAVLKSKTSDFEDIGTQVMTLLTYCSENQQHYLPVLLLVDDFEEQETVSDLCNHINSAIEKAYIGYETPLVIILNCMRSQRPEKDSKKPDSVAVINKLSSKEQRAFDSKFEEIENRHQNCRDFYSFMIMKENFNRKYIENVVKHILKGMNVDSKEGQLIAFLSLLNSYISDSDISLVQCENFLGLTNQREYWSRRCLEDKMGIYSTILIRTKVVDCGSYEGVRIIHPLIASRCLEELKLTSEVAKSDIALKLLKEDEFYQPGIRRNKFVRTVQMLLLKRQNQNNKETLNPRKDINTSFSPFIVDIQKEEGNDQVRKVLGEGTIRFEHYAFIYQALARHCYINENNFEDAIQWAEKAKMKGPGNSFISDTLGQVYKSQIIFYKDKIQKGKVASPQELEDLLSIAVKASDAFRESQKHNENRHYETGQCPRSKRRGGVYNTSCYLGEIEVCMQIIQLLGKVPLFNEGNRGVIVQLLCGKHKVLLDPSVQKNEYYPVIEKHRHYLNALQCHLQKTFDTLQDYFSLLKERDNEREILEEKNQAKMKVFLRQYISIFFNLETMQSKVISFGKSFPEMIWWSKLEEYNAIRFSGLLRYLTENQKNAKEMEHIVDIYKLIVESANLPQMRVKQNFILSNIILNCLKPNSEFIQPLDKLKEMLQGVLQQVGLHHPYPHPYFLATLLFWPENQQLDENSRQLGKYITSLTLSFKKKYGQMCQAKQPFTHFYLGKGRGLHQFIHKERIEQCFQNESDLRVLWHRGDVWREEKVKDLLLRLSGRIENDFVYVDHGTKENLEIPVQPAFLSQLRRGRSMERVSFYLGFSIGGPLAYDIKIIETEPVKAPSCVSQDLELKGAPETILDQPSHFTKEADKGFPMWEFMIYS